MSRRDQDIRDAILAALPGDLGAVPLSQFDERLQADGMAVTCARLQEIVDAELANPHEGNALRFCIRRSQFEAWMTRKGA